MRPIPPHEIRTPPPRFRGDPGISRPCFCGPRSLMDGWARSGPRRGVPRSPKGDGGEPTIWGTWPPNLSPPSPAGALAMRFQVWAPRAGRVELQLGGERRGLRSAGGGWWECDAEAAPGADYGYRPDRGDPP